MPVAEARRLHHDLPLAFQMMRLISEGLDVFEAMRTLDRIPHAGHWHTEMERSGQEWFFRAESAESRDHAVTAEAGYRTAALYFLGASLWNVPDPALCSATYRRCVEAFRRSTALSARPVVPVSVPFSGVDLPGYLYLPAADRGPYPVVIVLGGTDASKEEADGLGARALAARGIAALTFDGPGQGETVRELGLPTRADYEVVISAAIDFLEGRPEVDSRRLGLVGASLGTYYVVRGATDPRVAAVVCHGAIYDVVADSARLRRTPEHALFRMISGMESTEEVLGFFARMKLEDVAGKVTCPALVVHSGRDNVVDASAAKRLVAALGGPVELEFIDDGLHCNVEYYARVQPLMYDWLAEQLG
ncbi:alpha/beta hydrolase [Streptomyces sp. NPDC048278]|uniref:alpha/beta hydrolase family protein n=1 Tax=Streptomyces sp. NPDC048278 TaxID=3155809 RepID=UPI003425EA6B